MSAVGEPKVVEQQPLKRGLFLPPLLQLLLSGSGLLITGGLVLLFFLGAVLGLVNGEGSEDVFPLFSMVWSGLLVFVLFIPSVLLSIRQLGSKEVKGPGRRYFTISIVGLLLWAPLVLLGQWLANQSFVPWLVLPPLQIVAVGVPILFLIELGRRKLPRQTVSGWDVFGFGVVLTQPIVLVVEILLLLVVGVGVMVWVSTQPELMDILMRLAQRLQDAQFDPQILEQALTPYLQQPWVIYLFLAVGAGLIPMIEELLKPLAVWVMIRRKFTESEGFVMGLYAGGTFALLESLGMVSSATQAEWGLILAARVGTAILHVTSTAMMGWALGAAWKQKKYFQLGLTFFLSILLHGIWNIFGLLMGVTPFLPISNLITALNLTGPVALGILAFVMLLIIIGANRRLRKIEPQDAQELDQINLQSLED
jgi:hypothetical protein